MNLLEYKLLNSSEEELKILVPKVVAVIEAVQFMAGDDPMYLSSRVFEALEALEKE